MCRHAQISVLVHSTLAPSAACRSLQYGSDDRNRNRGKNDHLKHSHLAVTVFCRIRMTLTDRSQRRTIIDMHDTAHPPPHLTLPSILFRPHLLVCKYAVPSRSLAGTAGLGPFLFLFPVPVKKSRIVGQPQRARDGQRVEWNDTPRDGSRCCHHLSTNTSRHGKPYYQLAKDDNSGRWNSCGGTAEGARRIFLLSIPSDSFFFGGAFAMMRTIHTDRITGDRDGDEHEKLPFPSMAKFGTGTMEWRIC